MNLITKQENAMNKDRLEDLFQELRSEEPKLSFTDVSRRFLKAQQVGWLGVFLIRFFRKWNYLNWIIMTTSIITATALGILLSGAPKSQTGGKYVTGTPEPQSTFATETEELIEIEYFSADSQLVQRVRKTKGQTQIENIQTLPPEPLPNAKVHHLAPRPSVKDSTAEVTRDRIFQITHNMQDVDLQEIEKAAKAAGLDFHYKYLVWKGKVKKIEYWINWTGPDGKYCNYHAALKGKFSTTVGWTEDAGGKAIGLLN